jgi:hypothetical protein
MFSAISRTDITRPLQILTETVSLPSQAKNTGYQIQAGSCACMVCIRLHLLSFYEENPNGRLVRK